MRCARWRAELAVQHDGLGIVSLPLSYGQLWIIAQHGSDTHQDAIVQAAKLMGKASGLWPAKTERLSGPGSDAAVPALSITQRDKRSVRRREGRSALPQPVFNLLIQTHEFRQRAEPPRRANSAGGSSA